MILKQTSIIMGLCLAVSSLFAGNSLAQNAVQPNATAPQELVKDVNLTKGTSSWFLEQHLEAKGALSIENDTTMNKPVLRVTISNAGKEGWHAQLTQNVAVQKNQYYIFSFSAKAEKDITISGGIGQAHDPWKSISSDFILPLTTSWKTFRFIFTAANDDTNARISFSGLGKQAMSYWFSGISLQSIPAPAPGQNKLMNADFSLGSDFWTLQANATAKAQASIVKEFNGKNAYQIEVLQPSTEGWHIQAFQIMKVAKADKSYNVSFWAKAEKPYTICGLIQQGYAPYGSVGPVSRIDLTTNWKQYKFTIPVNADDDNVRFMFTELGRYTGKIWFADASLAATGTDNK